MAYSADKKPGELTALTSLATDDVIVVGDTSDASEVAKGITKANLITDLTTSFATSGHNHTGTYAPASHAHEGTAILSTGETGGTKFLREDGDGTCSWQTIAGGGNVSKVGTPADNQIGVWTGDGTIEGDAGFTFDGGLNVTVANAENKVGLTITQNDVTNNPTAFKILTATDGYDAAFENTRVGTSGSFLEFYHNSATPSAGDNIGGIDFYGNDSDANKEFYGGVYASITDTTNGSESAQILISSLLNSVDTVLLRVGGDNAYVEVGSGLNSGVLTSNGNQDLILQTGNATTGNITIVDGANGNVQVNPNGTGALAVSTTIELGHASDTTISRVSAGVAAIEGNNIVTANMAASAANINTGTSTTVFNTPDALAGSYAGTKSLSVQLFDGATDVTTGDGKAYITIPESLNGMNLIRAQATVVTAGTTNATTVMVHNKTDSQDMLSGAISIASGGTVGTVGTVNGTYDDVATNDVLRIDVDSVSTTAPKGLMVVLEFRLP